MVGAPRTQSSQPGTDQAGALFSCDIQTGLPTRRCEQLQVEYPVETESRRPPQMLGNKVLHREGKNHQLLGFVVQSTGIIKCIWTLEFNYIYGHSIVVLVLYFFSAENFSYLPVPHGGNKRWCKCCESRRNFFKHSRCIFIDSKTHLFPGQVQALFSILIDPLSTGTKNGSAMVISLKYYIMI